MSQRHPVTRFANNMPLSGLLRLMHDGWMILTRLSVLFACSVAMVVVSQIAAAQRVFDVREYGATGRKSDDARPALQKAIDACGKTGGGQVYVPPEEYT
jgi:hypothetical protein